MGLLLPFLCPHSAATWSLLVEEKRKTPADAGTQDTQWAMFGSSNISNRNEAGGQVIVLLQLVVSVPAVPVGRCRAAVALLGGAGLPGVGLLLSCRAAGQHSASFSLFLEMKWKVPLLLSVHWIESPMLGRPQHHKPLSPLPRPELRLHTAAPWSSEGWESLAQRAGGAPAFLVLLQRLWLNVPPHPTGESVRIVAAHDSLTETLLPYVQGLKEVGAPEWELVVEGTGVEVVEGGSNLTIGRGGSAMGGTTCMNSAGSFVLCGSSADTRSPSVSGAMSSTSSLSPPKTLITLVCSSSSSSSSSSVLLAAASSFSASSSISASSRSRWTMSELEEWFSSPPSPWSSLLSRLLVSSGSASPTVDQDSASRLSLCQGAKVSTWVGGRAAEVGLRDPDSPSPPSPLLDSTGAFPSRMKTGCCRDKIDLQRGNFQFTSVSVCGI
ncbi:hypothetical protein F7725_021670 [Dissostichus mawsoni]|uniref:Uncharacterized protein n=1 Tax=Dissostichus mawsoni TaxID=36200 RepID=A0A7J5ZDT3_DISMA|nr:hypothetical protein F7725_021670 [Dissostichus mawsoni]